jgi:murein DD-endopeptidase MepM/ murein hydrolase activator NlpD
VDYRQMTRAYARRYGIPEELALAQIGAESGFNPNAVSPAGALGIAQFMPGTARGLKINPRDPRSALEGYGRHMSTLIRNFKGDYRKALAAYNAGAGAVQKYGGIPPYTETRNYVSKIMKEWGGPGQQNAVRTPLAARRGGGGAAAPGGSGAAGAPGAVAPLQLDPNTQALLQRWMAVEERGLSSKGTSTKQGEKMWAKLEKRLLAAAAARPPAAQQQLASNQITTGARQVGAQAAQAMPVGPGGFVMPLSTKMGGSAFNYADAEGAPDAKGVRRHSAVDWFAPPGSPVRAPVGGKIVEVKASRGNSGQVYGGVVKVQDASGRVFVFRHVDPKGVRVGQRVGAGQVIAGVTDWTGGSDHAHHEIWKTLAGGYNHGNMIDPATFYRRK